MDTCPGHVLLLASALHVKKVAILQDPVHKQCVSNAETLATSRLIAGINPKSPSSTKLSFYYTLFLKRT